MGTEQAPLPPASYDVTWNALEGAAGALAAETLEALRQGEAGRARVAVRGFAALVEACAAVGAGQGGGVIEAPVPALAAPAALPPRADVPAPKAAEASPGRGRSAKGRASKKGRGR